MSARTRWVGLVVGLLLLSLGIQGTALFLSLNDPSFAVEPDYERKALEWDRHMERVAESERLGWSVEVETAGARPRRSSTVRVVLSDGDGRPVEGAEVSLVAFHNARAAHRLRAEAHETAPGVYEASLRLFRPGLWEFRVAARRSEERFEHTLRVSVADARDVRGGGP